MLRAFCHHVATCCGMLAKRLQMLCQKCDHFQYLRQQHSTCCNTSQHGGQMHTTCCATQMLQCVALKLCHCLARALVLNLVCYFLASVLPVLGVIIK